MTPEREKEVREIVAKALEHRNRCVEAHKVRFMPERVDLSVAVVLEALLPLLDAAEAEAARGREAVEACAEATKVHDTTTIATSLTFSDVVRIGRAELARREAAKPRPRFVAVNGEVKDMRTGCVSALFFGPGQCERASAEADRLNAEVKP